MPNLVHWDPFGDRSQLGALTESMDDWMSRFMRPRLMMGRPAQLDISIDVTEVGNTYVIKADVPGAKKEDITVSVDGNVVSIGAEVKKESTDKQGERSLRSERYFGSLFRSFTLPAEVDQSKSEAKYSNGVLELRLTKRSGSASKRLEVR